MEPLEYDTRSNLLGCTASSEGFSEREANVITSSHHFDRPECLLHEEELVSKKAHRLLC